MIMQISSGHHESVFATVLEWQTQGYRSVLVTVASTYGASPRPVGSMAAIREDGVLAGSVSGGCIEEALIDDVLQGIYWHAENSVIQRIFGINAEEQDRFRLPCGGSLTVYIETQWDPAHVQLLVSLLQQRRTLRRFVFWSGYATYVNLPTLLVKPVPLTLYNDHFTVDIGPQYHAIIIGATEITDYLVPILISLDFNITVCEPRPEYQKQYNHMAVELCSDMPDECLACIAIDQNTAVLAISHDLKLDDLALLEILSSEAFYIGALGSVTTTGKRFDRLTRFGATAVQLARLHAPIGLPIHSKTPAEIAVSIAADLIAQRQINLSNLSKVDRPVCGI